MSAGGTVVVTGGCGFIGVNLGRMLRDQGFEPLAFDDLSAGSRDEALAWGYERVMVGGVRDREALESCFEGVEAVVHLAARTGVAESVADPHTSLEVNAGGTLAVLAAARAAGVPRVVLASSNAVVAGVEPPVDESSVPHPLSPYGASKVAAEGLCQAFSAGGELSTVILRFGNIYGPGSRHKGRVVAEFVRRRLAGEPLVVHGDGEQTRDFLYVDDLGRAVLAALEGKWWGEVFQLGSGAETTVNQLFKLVEEVVGEGPLQILPGPERPGEARRSFARIDKAREVLGFTPRVSLAEGLGRTAAWFGG